MKDINTITLVSPPWIQGEANPYPPLGIAFIAAVLEENGYKVNLFDLSLEFEKTFEEKIRMVLDSKPDLLGISCMTNTYTNAIKIARDIKKYINVPIVMGGPHPSIFPEETLSDEAVDFIVSGEGEYTMLELVRDAHEQYTNIPGLAFKKAGVIKVNPAREYIPDLDALPFPARHLLRLDEYRLTTPHGERMATIMTSRGCPYQCSYCYKGMFGNHYRARSAENIIDEIKELESRFGYRNFYFIDDLFTFNPERVSRFCETIIAEKIDIGWQCLARVDRVDYELLRLMKAAGCFKVHFGIESGDQEILKRIRKHTTLDRIRTAVFAARRSGIQTKGYFMLGLPGDTRISMMKTIRFAESLQLDETMFSITTPLPGAELWNSVPQNHKIRMFDNPENIYYFSDNENRSLLYNMSAEQDSVVLEMLSRSRELERRARLVKKFGTVPGILIYKLRKPLSYIQKALHGSALKPGAWERVAHKDNCIICSGDSEK
jgi:anaerobic magnesium-protoporphyrin IX monomethyl ester cyclase